MQKPIQAILKGLAVFIAQSMPPVKYTVHQLDGALEITFPVFVPLGKLFHGK
jgi:hypothetical protein